MICKQDKNSVIWSMMKDSVLMTKHRLYWYREQNFPINVWLTMNFCFQRIGTGYLSVSRRSLATPVADSTEGWYRCSGTRDSSVERKLSSSVNYAMRNLSINIVCWDTIIYTWRTWRNRLDLNTKRSRLDKRNQRFGCVKRDVTAFDSFQAYSSIRYHRLRLLH